MSELLAKLRERFPASAVKTRRQGNKDLQYIDIATTINRLNDLVGMNWDWHIVSSNVVPIEGKKWHGAVQGELIIHESRVDGDFDFGRTSRRSGVGAGVGVDPDMAIKTADAEALKKAGHKFGIGLELWDEDVRTSNEKIMRGIGSDDLNALKMAVFELALVGGAEPSKAGVAAYFGVSEEALVEKEVLQELLTRSTAATNDLRN